MISAIIIYINGYLSYGYISFLQRIVNLEGQGIHKVGVIIRHRFRSILYLYFPSRILITLAHIFKKFARVETKTNKLPSQF